MRKIILSAVLLTGLATQAFAEVNVSADVVSRYLWRGADYGNAMAVQPSISYTSGSVTVGYWGSQALNGAFNETDLYVGIDLGSFALTITDYTDTAPDLFKVGDADIEVMASFSAGDISVAAAIMATNDTDLWVELGYGLGQIGDADVSVSLGVGNEQYSSNGDPKLALLGINASSGDYFASYQINVERKANMAFIGKSF